MVARVRDTRETKVPRAQPRAAFRIDDRREVERGERDDVSVRRRNRSIATERDQSSSLADLELRYRRSRVPARRFAGSLAGGAAAPRRARGASSSEHCSESGREQQSRGSLIGDVRILTRVARASRELRVWRESTGEIGDNCEDATPPTDDRSRVSRRGAPFLARSRTDEIDGAHGA